MECSPLRQLHQSDVQEWGGPDEQGIEVLTPNTFEGGIDFMAGVGIENLDLQAHAASGSLQISQCNLGARCIVWIDELTQEFQPLCRQLGRQKIDARHVAARTGKT
jgi:hypothetical protein